MASPYSEMRAPVHLPSRHRRAERGSVILLVLGVILLTAFLLTRLMERAGTELQVESRSARRGALREEAYGALETVLAVLADARAAQGGLHSPAQGWDTPLDFAGYEPERGRTVDVAFDDETGRLSLPRAGEASLQNLLVSLGAMPAQAEELTDAVLAWTNAGHVPRFAESDPQRYELERPPYRAPRRPLRSWEELRAIPVARELLFDEQGDWNEIGRGLRQYVSLHGFARVNVNTAPPPVLQALGLDPSRLEAVRLPGPAGGPPPVFRSAAEAAGVLGPAVGQPGLGADILCLRILVTVREGGRTFHLSATVRPATRDAPGEAATDPAAQENAPRPATRKNIDYPFRVLELRESDHPPA